ncbi:hypothetical protein, partial [uncultured Kiloniella sp.]|uniref:hypothetical protein n=1 Tax=uncultured Kiloniella sp. TaxID=1133091 RepID=UPI0026381595
MSSAESKPPEMIHIPQFFERDGTIHGKTSPEGTPPDAVPAFDPTTFQAGLEEAFANAVDEQGIYVNPDDLEAVPGAVENSHSALYSTVEGSDNLGEPSYSDPEGVDTPGASGVEPFDSGDEPEWSDSESENDDPSGPVLDGYGDGE